ncbi:hypothetical protein B0H13DRAFT_1858220 [Mycena leptocephala]|nr:hypothetical protein B0H13DRAFT_1858220 [Mycena leptocephala]
MRLHSKTRRRRWSQLLETQHGKCMRGTTAWGGMEWAQAQIKGCGMSKALNRGLLKRLHRLRQDKKQPKTRGILGYKYESEKRQNENRRRYKGEFAPTENRDGDGTNGALQMPEKRTSRRCNHPDIKKRTDGLTLTATPPDLNSGHFGKMVRELRSLDGNRVESVCHRDAPEKIISTATSVLWPPRLVGASLDLMANKKKEKRRTETCRTQQAIALSDQMLIDPVHFKIETPDGTMSICGVGKESARRSGLRGFGVPPPPDNGSQHVLEGRWDMDQECLGHKNQVNDYNNDKENPRSARTKYPLNVHPAPVAYKKTE